MFVRKNTSIETLLDLEEFLSKDFSGSNFSPFLLTEDLRKAKKNYVALGVMRSNAVDLKFAFYFSPVESDCYIVDENAVAERVMIGFDEIRDFSKYIVEKYKL